MSRYFTPRTVYVIIKFWTVDATVFSDDKRCPRCQIPTHVLTVLNI